MDFIGLRWNSELLPFTLVWDWALWSSRETPCSAPRGWLSWRLSRLQLGKRYSCSTRITTSAWRGLGRPGRGATCHFRCPLRLGRWTDIFPARKQIFGYRLTVLSKLILDRRLCFWSVFGASEELRWAESTYGHLTWPAVTFGTRTPLLGFLSNTILLFEVAQWLLWLIYR